MSTEENKAIVRRFFEEIWNSGDMTVVDEIWAVRDPEQYKIHVTELRTATPDLHFTIEDEIAEGDKVVVRYTVRATHKGEYLGQAPTGKPFTMTGIHIFRIARGKLAEMWFEMDRLGFMQQIGVVLPPGVN